MARRRRSLLGDKARPVTGIPAPARKGPQGASGPSERPADAEALDAEAPETDAESPPEEEEAEAVSAPPEPISYEAPPPEAFVPVPRIGVDGLPMEAPIERVATGAEPSEGASSQDLYDDDEDALVEDDSPILGADIEVPEPDEGDDALAPPDEVAAHLHTAPPTPSQPADLSGGVSDDELVVFDEAPGAEALPEPEVSVDLDLSVDLPSATPPPVSRAEHAVPSVDEDEDALEAPPLGELPPGFDPGDQLRSGTPHVPPPRQAATVPGFEVENDGFLEDAADPPSEDEPSSVPEDIANMYRAPMNVPEPPPIPGILDRYTPAPARRDEAEASDGARREFRPVKAGGAEAPAVRPPRGLWDETPMPSVRDRTPTPPPAVRPAAPPPDRPMWQDPWLITAVGVAFVAALLVVGLLIVYLQPPFGEEPVAPDRGTPATISPTMPSGAAPTSGEPVAPEVDAGAMPTADPTAAPEEPPPSETVETAPKPQPRVRNTTPRQPEPQARTGKLRISATRSVLVYVNGVPEGYTPLSLDKPAGKYVITAQVNGREVEKRVDLASGSIRSVDF